MHMLLGKRPAGLREQRWRRGVRAAGRRRPRAAERRRSKLGRRQPRARSGRWRGGVGTVRSRASRWAAVLAARSARCAARSGIELAGALEAEQALGRAALAGGGGDVAGRSGVLAPAPLAQAGAEHGGSQHRVRESGRQVGGCRETPARLRNWRQQAGRRRQAGSWRGRLTRRCRQSRRRRRSCRCWCRSSRWGWCWRGHRPGRWPCTAAGRPGRRHGLCKCLRPRQRSTAIRRRCRHRR